MTALEDAPPGKRPVSTHDSVIGVVRDGEVTRIALGGEVDFHTAGRLQALIDAECQGRADRVVIDLSAIEFVDSHGLRLLADAHRRLASDGRRLEIMRPPDPVWHAFVLTGLDEVLNVDTSQQH